ncbi:DUF6383 domain-containing protein [Parabacteroides sp. PF5-6]|uniref:DUF6383 domain-containing protein n=1 Tax=Parabacteroides sp. PF5-6 TaxID=1742403 RepID=UPI0024073DE0|nr:DUF6383 domain-containing protein [Parabacteroides sp. PF5-6]MDF9829115.1 hypothetical protein [Parabacteroides sp. PF5-6]
MNKKFFTLLVALFAMISFGAQAAVNEPVNASGSFKSTTTYLLKTGDLYLTLDNEASSGLIALDLATISTNYATLQRASWFITASTVEGNAVYEFRNAYSGAALSLDLSNALTSLANAKGGENLMGGDLVKWNGERGRVTAGTDFFFNYTNNANKPDQVVVLGLYPAAGSAPAKVVPLLFDDKENVKTDAIDAAVVANAKGAAAVAAVQAKLASKSAAVLTAAKAMYDGWTNVADDNQDLLDALGTAIEALAVEMGKPANMVVLDDLDINTAFETYQDALNDAVTDFKALAADVDTKEADVKTVYNAAVSLFDAEGDEKKAFDKALADAQAGAVAGGAIKITPQTITGTLPLAANDINTLLGTAGDYDGGIVATLNSYFSLTTNPENTQPSDFTKELQARALTVDPANDDLLDVTKLTLKDASYRDITNAWVALYSKADKKYLVVDTAVYAGTEQLKRDLIKTTVDDLYGATTKTTKRLADSYLFKFTYNVAKGTVEIESKAYINKAADKADANNSKWAKADIADGRISQKHLLTYAQLVNEIVYTFGEESILVSHIGTSSQYVQTQVPTGVYILQVVDSKDESRIGKYAKYSLDGKFEYVNKEKRQNFQHIPAAQWVVVSTKNNTATFVNREFANGQGQDIFTGATQVTYKTDKANQFFTLGGDVIEYTKVDDIKTKTLGYKNVSAEAATKQRFSFRYLHELSMDNPVVISENGLFVGAADAAPAEFELVPVPVGDGKVFVDKYGATSTALKDLVALERTPYYVHLNNLSLWGMANEMVIAYDKANKKYILSEDEEAAVPFYLKENYEVDEDGVVSCYYVFVAVEMGEEGEDVIATPVSKVAVSTNLLAWVYGSLGDVTGEEVATSAFKVEEETYPYYRKLGVLEEEDDNINIVKFFRVNSNVPEYLYEDANSVYSKDKGMNFLGVEGKGDEAKAAMKVRYMKGTAMPQYLISLAETEEEDVEDIPCPIHGMDCIHAVKGSEGYITGRFLVNLIDSVAEYGFDTPFAWEKTYTRLAFVEGKLTKDSVLHITSSALGADANVFDLKKNQHSPVLFQFRLLEEGSNDFLIESESWKFDDEILPFAGGIAPLWNGGWVKIQNGVPVITNFWSEGSEMADAYQNAEKFNLELTDENPTSNKGIDAAKVNVVAGQGYVTIKGAAGKQVVVANILGQVIANVVLDKDEQTIAAPAGVVVVSVAGEATKALVK